MSASAPISCITAVAAKLYLFHSVIVITQNVMKNNDDSSVNT